MVELFGDAIEHGWMPHKESTWTYRYARLREPITLRYYTGNWKDNEPVMRNVPCAAGQWVKIVMVSRFGDVGITADLTADFNYGARVMLDSLYDFSNEPKEINCSANSSS